MVCSVPTAMSGTSRASCGVEAGTRTRPNMPGVNTPLGFLNTARARMVPVEVLITLLTKSMWPSCGKPFSSISLSDTATPPPRLATSPPSFAMRS